MSASGVLTTASGLVFAGDGDGNVMAFDSRTGKNLWHYQLGSSMRSTAGTTYMLDGRQYLLVPVGQHAHRVRAAAAVAQPFRAARRAVGRPERPALRCRGTSKRTR